MLVPYISMVIYMVIYSKMGPQVTGLACLSQCWVDGWFPPSKGLPWALHISWIPEDPSLLYEIVNYSIMGPPAPLHLFFSHWYFIQKQEKFGLNLILQAHVKDHSADYTCLLQLKGNQGCLSLQVTLTWHFHFLALLECFLVCSCLKSLIQDLFQE